MGPQGIIQIMTCWAHFWDHFGPPCGSVLASFLDPPWAQKGRPNGDLFGDFWGHFRRPLGSVLSSFLDPPKSRVSEKKVHEPRARAVFFLNTGIWRGPFWPLRGEPASTCETFARLRILSLDWGFILKVATESVQRAADPAHNS